MASHKIAIIQFYPKACTPLTLVILQSYMKEVLIFQDKPNELESNHCRAIGFMREAAAAGAQLAVLPEYHLGDFVTSHDSVARQQCANWKRYLDAYCALAKECNICVVPGSFSELHDDNTVVNATYFIDNDGAICGKYEKKNLWHPERPFVKPSQRDTRHTAFDTPLGKVGMVICWDLAFPEAFRELIIQGAKMIIVPAYWKYTDASDIGMKRNPKSEGVFLDAAVVSRAFENTCAVVFCNVAGPENEGFAGLSQVALPFVGCIERFGNSEEGMKIVDVDMNILEEAESVYKIREDIATPEWHYGYRH